MRFITSAFIKSDDLSDYVYVPYALAQIFKDESSPSYVDEGTFKYLVGLFIIPNFESVLLSSPGIMVPINKKTLKDALTCEIKSTYPYIGAIPRIYS